ncbi:MAG: hypothetical protein QNJ94_09930 [Alphaproteobacteria bacterium]|nr:hypothetical protein [Alphaproteobacteria bacterium]
MPDSGVQQPLSPAPDAPSWLTVWLPVLIFIAVYALRLLDRDNTLVSLWIDSEYGAVENGTVLLLLIAVAFLLPAYVNRKRLPHRALGWWLLACIIGCLFFAGEEASWGQHWFGWESPEFFRDHNRHGETNLHNIGLQTTSRIPKFILSAGIVALGLIVPLIQRRRRIAFDPVTNRLYWFLPTSAGMVWVVFLIITRLIERAKTWSEIDSLAFALNLKEVNELFLAGFILVYSVSLWRRLRHFQPALQGPLAAATT